MADTGGAHVSTRTPETLDPAFVEGLEDLDVGEVRRRRDVAMLVRDYHSYLRRLVQTRQDMLAVERDRRAAGAEPVSVVDRLKAVLAETPRGSSRGEALRLTLSAQDMADADDAVNAVVPPSISTEPEGLTDDQLESALAALAEMERSVSSQRSAVFRVHDRLQEELKRRYREDPALIPTDL